LKIRNVKNKSILIKMLDKIGKDYTQYIRFKMFAQRKKERLKNMNEEENSLQINNNNDKSKSVCMNKDLTSQISEISNSQIFDTHRKPNTLLKNALNK